MKLVNSTPESRREYAIKRGFTKYPDICNNFVTFAKLIVPTWTESKLPWQWFHEDIANRYQAIIDGDIDCYSIEMPPQHGKSLLCTLFIAYLFGLNPNLHIIYATHSEVRAIKVTKEYVYVFMNHPIYLQLFPHVVFKTDRDDLLSEREAVKKRKSMTHKDNAFTLKNQKGDLWKGSFTAIGLSQGQHGNPANLYFLDDYVGQSADAMSEHYRIKLTEWFYTDMVSRLNPNFKIIMNCTRWYHLDPIGLLTNEISKLNTKALELGKPLRNMVSLKIPAYWWDNPYLSENDTRTKVGELLWEDFFDKYSMAEKGMFFNANYNCDPSETNEMQQIQQIDFAEYSALPNGGRYMFSIDGASTTNKSSDKSAIGYWYIVGAKRYLVRLWYDRWSIPDLTKLVYELLQTYEYSLCLIEFANSGVSLSQALQQLGCHGIVQLGFTGRPIGEKKLNYGGITTRSNSKVERYNRIVPDVCLWRSNAANPNPDLKKIYIPSFDIAHKQAFIHQLTTFNGDPLREDDLVDMATYLLFYTINTVSRASVFVSIANNLTNNFQIGYNPSRV